MLVYGLAAVANDFWYEQLIKRGITNWEVPLLLVPMLNMQWLILLAIAAGTYILFFRRVSAGTPTGNRRLIWPLVLPLPVIGLLAVGLAHGARQHATTFGSVDGIAFVLATTSGSHVFVTRGGSLVQLTYGSHSELAPAWSPDGRRLAFQSNRDGNWEVYVADADGSHVRRLTHGDARDGEPAWSGDGRRIDFVRSGRLYSMQADGTAARALGIDGAWPSLSPDGKSLAYDVEFGGHHGIVVEQSGRALRLDVHDGRRPVWSPRGDLIAYQCRLGAHWRICVLNPRTGALRFLTGHDSDAFAPSWSPDGSRIAFLSDRDGNDQLYAMRADGGAVVRLTSGQADKDTPAWRP
jgi:Tol biopolymer transport system component